MRFQFHAKDCTGCCACQMACLDQRDIDTAAGQKPLRYVECRERGTEISWVSVGCVHCGACAKACPNSAIYRDAESGLVLLRQEACVGCGACVKACPLGVISSMPQTGTAMKCDGCLARVQAGLLPACVHTCPTGALSVSE